MNPYDNNPFETKRFNDSRSEFDANVELAKTAAKKEEAKCEETADLYRDKDQVKSGMASRRSYYYMGLRHGLTQARNLATKSMK